MTVKVFRGPVVDPIDSVRVALRRTFLEQVVEIAQRRYERHNKASRGLADKQDIVDKCMLKLLRARLELDIFNIEHPKEIT